MDDLEKAVTRTEQQYKHSLKGTESDKHSVSPAFIFCCKKNVLFLVRTLVYCYLFF